MAIALRHPPKGCIHHTDRGSQYGSHDDQKILRRHGFQVSISAKRSCYDNSAVDLRPGARTGGAAGLTLEMNGNSYRLRQSRKTKSEA